LLNCIVNKDHNGITKTISHWRRKLGENFPASLNKINTLSKKNLRTLNSSMAITFKKRSSFTATIKKVIEHLDCSTISTANLGKAVRATPEKKPKPNWMNDSNKNASKLEKEGIENSTEEGYKATGRYIDKKKPRMQNSKPLLKYVFYFLAIFIAALASWLLA